MAPSGSLRTISCRVTADTVVDPPRSTMAGALVDHLDVQIGGAEHDVVAVGLDQHVGQDRNGVAPFDDGLRLGDGLQKRGTFDAEFHGLFPCPGPGMPRDR